MISSAHFTELLAYRRLWTWDRDLWFSQLHATLAAAGRPPEKFIPIRCGDEQSRRDRETAAAERDMDRRAEEYD